MKTKCFGAFMRNVFWDQWISAFFKSILTWEGTNPCFWGGKQGLGERRGMQDGTRQRSRWHVCQGWGLHLHIQRLLFRPHLHRLLFGPAFVWMGITHRLHGRVGVLRRPHDEGRRAGAYKETIIHCLFNAIKLYHFALLFYCTTKKSMRIIQSPLDGYGGRDSGVSGISSSPPSSSCGVQEPASEEPVAWQKKNTWSEYKIKLNM